MHAKSNYGNTSSGGWSFCEFVDFDLLYIETVGAGYRSVYRDSCHYELTLVVMFTIALQTRSIQCRRQGFSWGAAPPRPSARAGGRGFWGAHFGLHFIVFFVFKF